MSIMQLRLLTELIERKEQVITFPELERIDVSFSNHCYIAQCVRRINKKLGHGHVKGVYKEGYMYTEDPPTQKS